MLGFIFAEGDTCEETKKALSAARQQLHVAAPPGPGSGFDIKPTLTPTVTGDRYELRQLVAGETECCPWADWRVQTDAGQIVLDVRSAGEGIATLHSMFTSLHPAPSARCD